MRRAMSAAALVRWLIASQSRRMVRCLVQPYQAAYLPEPADPGVWKLP